VAGRFAWQFIATPDMRDERPEEFGVLEPEKS
jgi:hypothetical protein